MNRLIVTTLALVLALPAAAVAETVFTAPLLQAGEDERVEGAGGCPVEPDFVAGTVSTAYGLQVGGNAWGCDSEWGTSVEFDLSAFTPGVTVLAAELVVRKTGHEEGLPYVGAYAYAADGGEVLVPRAALDEFSALDNRAPGAANVDLAFAVTDHVADLVADGEPRAGFLLCGVFSEVGRMDRIYVGGATHAAPPRLLITVEGTVAGEGLAWGAVKTLWR